MPYPFVTFTKTEHGTYEQEYIKKGYLHNCTFFDVNGLEMFSEHVYEGCSYVYRAPFHEIREGLCKSAVDDFHAVMTVVNYANRNNMGYVVLKDEANFVYEVRIADFYDMLLKTVVDKGVFEGDFYFHQQASNNFLKMR